MADRPRVDSTRFRVLKALQIAVAVGLFVLFWLIYPGVLLLFTGAVAACYVIASIAAARDRLLGIWVAFAFTVLAFGFSAWGVYRYIDNGFEFLSGNFPGRAGIHWPAYLFLLIALGSLAVIVLHALSRRPLFPIRDDHAEQAPRAHP